MRIMHPTRKYMKSCPLCRANFIIVVFLTFKNVFTAPSAVCPRCSNHIFF
jgi:hypothetical protein